MRKTELDLDIVAWLAKHEPASTDPQALADAIAEARRLSRERNADAMACMPPSLIPASETSSEIEGPAGTLTIRVLRPAGTSAPKPTVVYFHGGGWTVGSIDSHLGHARRICTQVDAVVVSVGYRLAPEDRFPAAFDDAVAAAEWAAQHLDELGGTDQLVVAGDSVGGQLAASVAIARRDAGQPLAAQLLLYPVTDVAGLYADEAINAGFMSRRTAAKGYGLTLSDMVTFASHYVDAADTDDWRVSPLRHADLAGLAPAVVHTATLDVLRTEGNFYAQALERNGVKVLAREFPTLNHSYFGLGGVSPIADAAAAQAAEDLRALLS
ncbi:MAG TPA: alpha/beta hydrolase fold domain-containing protein [Jatrophihabitans sp.]